MSDKGETSTEETESKTSPPQQEEARVSHSSASTPTTHSPPLQAIEEVSVKPVKDDEASSSSPTQASVSLGDAEATTASASPPQEKLNNMKVDILLKPAGDAPIMKKKKWTVDRSKRIAWVSDFIKKYIKSDPSESLFLYVNQAFAPSPDTDIGSVFDCFGSDGKLVLHYCRTQAWG